MPHISEGVLHAYLDGALEHLAVAGELPEGMAAADVVAHLDMCPDCRARLQSEKEVRDRAALALRDASIDRVAIPPMPEPFSVEQPAPRSSATAASFSSPSMSAPRSRRFRGVPLAWAATAIVALGAGAFGMTRLMDGSSTDTSALTETAASPAEGQADDAAIETLADAATVVDEPTQDVVPPTPEPEVVVAVTPPPAPPPARQPAAPAPQTVALTGEAAGAAPPPSALASQAQAAADAAKVEAAKVADDALDADARRSVSAVRGGPAAPFEPILARALTDSDDPYRWRDATPADRAALPYEVIIISGGSTPAIEVVRESGQGVSRVTQRLTSGRLVELILWRPGARDVAAREYAGPGEPDRRVDAANIVGPRTLPDGRNELVLRAGGSGVWIAIRAAMQPAQVEQLAQRLTLFDPAAR